MTLKWCSTVILPCRNMLTPYAGQCTVSSASYVRSHDRRRSMQPRQKSMRLSRRVWTTATHLHIASPTIYSDVYTLCWMLRHAWSPVLEGVTTLHRSCSYISYQLDSGWILSSPSWSTRLSTTWHHNTFQTIASF